MVKFSCFNFFYLKQQQSVDNLYKFNKAKKMIIYLKHGFIVSINHDADFICTLDDILFYDLRCAPCY